MALQFYRAIEHMEVWSASRDGFSFVDCEEPQAVERGSILRTRQDLRLQAFGGRGLKSLQFPF